MLCVIIVIFSHTKKKVSKYSIYIYIYYLIEVGYYNRITATYNLCIGELL